MVENAIFQQSKIKLISELVPNLNLISALWTICKKIFQLYELEKTKMVDYISRRGLQIQKSSQLKEIRTKEQFN